MISRSESAFGVALIAAALLAAGAPSASANSFGPIHADGSDHTIWQVGLATYNMTAVQHARNRLDATDAGPTLLHSSNQGHTDVVAMDNYYTNTWAGFWNCVTYHPSGNCEQAEIRFNQRILDARSQAIRNAVGCHEFGHSIGLDHSTYTGNSTGSCLQDPIPGGISNSNYDSHDRDDHINPYYS